MDHGNSDPIKCKLFILTQSKYHPVSAQDRGPFWFSYILNEILEYIEIWNKFKV